MNEINALYRIKAGEEIEIDSEKKSALEVFRSLVLTMPEEYTNCIGCPELRRKYSLEYSFGRREEDYMTKEQIECDTNLCGNCAAWIDENAKTEYDNILAYAEKREVFGS